MTGKRTEYAEPLLIEWFARRLRFDRLAAALPGNLYPPYLLVAAGLFAEYGVFDAYNHFVTGKLTLLNDPASAVAGIGVVIAVVALRRLEGARQAAIIDLHKLDYNKTMGRRESRLLRLVRTIQWWDSSTDKYAQTDDRDTIFTTQHTTEQNSHSRIELGQAFHQIKSVLVPPRRTTTPFNPTVSLRYKFFAYLLTTGFTVLNTFIFIGYNTLVEIQGIFVGIAGLVLFPLMYIPLIVDVAVLSFGVSLLLPRQIASASPDLFYHSPRQFGGLKNVGKALRRSYFLYLFGFSLYAGLLYAQEYNILPTEYPPPSTFLDLIFAGLGIAGAAVIGYSVYRIHTFMKRKRDQRLDELEAEVRRRVEAPVDTYGEATLGVDGWETLQTEIEQVRSTRTYPFTPAASLRIGIGVLLPQALNLLRLALTTDLSAVVGA